MHSQMNKSWFDGHDVTIKTCDNFVINTVERYFTLC